MRCHFSHLPPLSVFDLFYSPAHFSFLLLSCTFNSPPSESAAEGGGRHTRTKRGQRQTEGGQQRNREGLREKGGGKRGRGRGREVRTMEGQVSVSP